MRFQLVTKPLSEIKSEYLVLPVFESEKNEFNLPLVQSFLKDNPKFGQLLESQLLYAPEQKILLLGLGKKDKFSFLNLQNWVGTATRQLVKKTKLASLILPMVNHLTPEEYGEALVVGAELASYDPTALFKSDHEANKLSTWEIVVGKADRGFQDGVRKGEIIAEAINLARLLGDLPANQLTPTYFLNEVKKIARPNRLKLTVLDERQAKRKGMGAFVGVAQGSDQPSYIIALEYTGDLKSKDKWGLVGKGITYDSGGMSLKPPDAMLDMKYDMCGAATVLVTMQALAKLKVKANVVGIMAVTENMISGKAQKPGDIVKTYSGKTAEILNTDAEGRLVLFDGLTWAQKEFKSTKLIDLATLTGAIIISLGDFITGAFGNNPKFTRELIDSGTRVGERIWEMPMDPEFDEMVKGEYADISNLGHGGSMGSRTAGSITGAKFIEAAVEGNRPWVHLDIAGTAWDLKGKSYRGVGATGVGVKTLIKLIGG